MQILKRLLYVVLIVPIFFVYGLVSAQIPEVVNATSSPTTLTPRNTINTNTPTTTSIQDSAQQGFNDTQSRQKGFANSAQEKKYNDCVKTRSIDGKENTTIKEACTCIAKGGILLSSDVPGTTNGSVIQGRCVYTNGDTVSVANQIFGMITRIVMIVLGITIFGMIVWGGMQFVLDPAGKGPENGKKMITNAVIAGFAVSMIGVVLRFINPNIFK